MLKSVFVGRRKFVQIRLPSTGECIYFDCMTSNRNQALKQAIPFIEAVQESKNEIVFWKFRDETIYFQGTDVAASQIEVDRPTWFKVLDFFGLAGE